MAEAELIEQLRAQVMSLKSPRSVIQGRGTDATNSSNSGESIRGRTGLNSTTTSKRQSRQHQASISKPKQVVDEFNDDGAPVNLDVGGYKYCTCVGTLKCIESSYFSLMVNGLFEPAKTEDGFIFIDRNGKLFEYILEYMRGYIQNERNELPDDLTVLKNLKKEAEYFRLPALTLRISQAIQKIEDNNMKMEECQDGGSSVIIQDEEIDQEIDIIYNAVTHNTPHFPEEKVTELVSRVNYCLAKRSTEGYKIKNMNSGVVADAVAKPQLFSMFMQVILMRERKTRTLHSPVISERSRQPATSTNSHQTHYRASPVNMQELQEQYSSDVDCGLGGGGGAGSGGVAAAAVGSVVGSGGISSGVGGNSQYPQILHNINYGGYIQRGSSSLVDRHNKPKTQNMANLSYLDQNYHSYHMSTENHGKKSPQLLSMSQTQINREYMSQEFKPDNYRTMGRSSTTNYRTYYPDGSGDGYEGNMYAESAMNSPRGLNNTYSLPMQHKKTFNTRYSSGPERSQGLPQLQLALINQGNEYLDGHQSPLSSRAGGGGGARHDGWVNQSPRNWHG